MKRITGLLITSQGAKVIDIEPSLDALHQAVNCRTFDIASRFIGNQHFDIYVDDEGLLIDNPIFNGVAIDCDELLAGNLLILKSDENGETLGLTMQEINHILTYVKLGKLFYSVREL